MSDKQTTTTTTSSSSNPTGQLDYKTWSVDQVSEWVNGIKYGTVIAPILKQQLIDGETLDTLTDSDIKSILPLGPAKSLLAAIKQLNPGTGIIKSWTFGFSVADSHYYHIDLKYLQLTELEEQVRVGGCYLVQGPYRSGKTTHLVGLLKSLTQKGYTVIDICLNLKTNFWDQFFSRIKHILNYNGSLNNKMELEDLLDKEKSMLKKDTKLVILIDEFQMLKNSPDREDFLLYLKYLFDRKYKSYLHCVTGFGTYQLIHLVGSSTSKPLIHSPFPYSNVTFIQPLPTEKVRSLFKEWADDLGIIFVPDVLTDIVNSIGGYAGILGIVGSTFQNNFNKDLSKVIDVNQWLRIRKLSLSSLVNVTDQFTRINTFIKGNQSASTIVKTILFSGYQTFDIPNNHMADALTLSDHGILIRDTESNNRFHLTSPLLTEYLISTIYTPPSCQIDDPSDIPSLVKSVITSIDLRPLKIKESQNSITQFTSEYIFQASFFAVLAHALQSHTKSLYCVTVEAKTVQMGNNRADLLLRNGTRTIFGFKSNLKCERVLDLVSVIDQVSKYSDYLEASNLVIINLVNSPPHNSFSGSQSSQFGKNLYYYEVVFKEFQLDIVPPSS